MKTRIITGVCMVIAAIPFLIWSDTPALSAAIVLLAVTLQSLYEMRRAARAKPEKQ